MKIFLIGMPGSGKTTLGTALAEKLQLDFVDLDHVIEQHLGKSVRQVFAEDGEEYFRQVESQLLRERAGSAQRFVMATGGGTPCFFDGIRAINQAGLSIFLDVPVSVLLTRMKKTDRPLLNTPDEGEKRLRLESLYNTRRPFYSQAQIILNNPDLSQLLRAIHLKK